MNEKTEQGAIGEVREAIVGSDGRTWVVGDRLAVQGKENCRDVRCTRLDGRCVGWHCSRCGAPCSSQGHDCPDERCGALAPNIFPRLHCEKAKHPDRLHASGGVWWLGEVDD